MSSKSLSIAVSSSSSRGGGSKSTATSPGPLSPDGSLSSPAFRNKVSKLPAIPQIRTSRPPAAHPLQESMMMPLSSSSMDQGNILYNTEMQGELYKKCKDQKWRLRFCEITGDFLTIYKNQSMVELLAIIDLAQIGQVTINTLQEIEPSPQGKIEITDGYVLSVDVKAGKSYLLCCPILSQAKQWKDSFDHIRDSNAQDNPSAKQRKQEAYIQLAPSASIDMQDYFNHNALLLDTSASNTPSRSGPNTPSTPHTSDSPSIKPRSPPFAKTKPPSPRKSPQLRGKHSIPDSPNLKREVSFNEEVQTELYTIDEGEEATEQTEVDDKRRRRSSKNKKSPPIEAEETAPFQPSKSLNRIQTALIFGFIAVLIGAARFYFMPTNDTTATGRHKNSFSSLLYLWNNPEKKEKVKIYLQQQSDSKPSTGNKAPSSASSAGRNNNSVGSLYPLVPAKTSAWRKFWQFLKRMPSNLFHSLFGHHKSSSK